MEEITEKLDRIIDKQFEMNGVLIRQQVILEEHVRRTNQLEDYVRTIEEDIQPIKNDFLGRKEVVSKIKVYMLIIGTTSGIIIGVVKLFLLKSF